MDLTTTLLSGTASLLSVAAAVVLVVGGIQLLRDKLIARRLHWLFAIAKFPIVVLASIATWLSYVSILATAGTPMPQMSNWLVLLSTLMSATFALAYPIALLIILSTRTAKSYFASLEEPEVVAANA
jgi:hypothetical protein